MIDDARSIPLRTDGGSWWLDEALASERAVQGAPAIEELRGDSAADVVVVGAGLVGLWSAISLLRDEPGLEVAVVEARLAGAAPSGMNGGFMYGYREYLEMLLRNFGAEPAAAILDAGEAAQDDIYATVGTDDVWLTEGAARVATAPRQIESLRMQHAAMLADDPATPVRLREGAEQQAHLRLRGILASVDMPHSAMVHPARLVRLLRRRAIGLGARVYEHSPVVAIDQVDGALVVRTAAGSIRAGRVIRATNHRQVASRGGRGHLTVLSSYAFATEPMPELLEAAGWPDGFGMWDARMFLNWFRTTRDGRLVFGSAAGPIARGAAVGPAIGDRRMVVRMAGSFRRIFPEFAGIRIEQCWSGPIDMSADQIPFVGREPGREVYFGCGLSGHGVNAAWVIGRVLASVALGRDDRWSRSPFATRRVPKLPPEPVRWLAGRTIKQAVLRIEDALDEGRPPSPVDRAIAGIPKLLRMKVGVRD